MTTKRESAPAHAGGYTLIELAVVLSLVGILTALALPSFDTLARNTRRAAIVNDLLTTVRLARSETLKQGRPLVVCGIEDRDRDGAFSAAERTCSGYDWTDGWLLARWTDADGDATVDPTELVALSVYGTGAADRLTVTAGNFMATPPVRPAGTLLVNPFGRRTSNGTITVCDARGAAAARGVIISSIGRARASATRADGTPLRCP
jgi:type IV fimbrial biogenesis protein FimT